MGYEPGGSFFRDRLELSRLLDLWSYLGLPLQVILTVPSGEQGHAVTSRTAGSLVWHIPRWLVAGKPGGMAQALPPGDLRQARRRSSLLEPTAGYRGVRVSLWRAG